MWFNAIQGEQQQQQCMFMHKNSQTFLKKPKKKKNT